MLDIYLVTSSSSNLDAYQVYGIWHWQQVGSFLFAVVEPNNRHIRYMLEGDVNITVLPSINYPAPLTDTVLTAMSKITPTITLDDTDTGYTLRKKFYDAGVTLFNPEI